MSQCHRIYADSCCALKSHVRVSLYICWFVLRPEESRHNVTLYTLIRAVFCTAMSQCHCIYVDSCCLLQNHVTVSLYIRWFVLSPAESCHSVTVYTLIRAVTCTAMSQCHCIYVNSCCLLQSHVTMPLYIRWFVMCPAQPCHNITVYMLIRAVSCRVMSQCHCIYVDSCCLLQSHVTVSLYTLIRSISCRVMSQCHCMYVHSCCLLQSHVTVSLYIRWLVLSPAESCHSVTVYTLTRAVFCRVMSQCHCIYVDSCCLLQSCRSVTVYTLIRAVSCRVMSQWHCIYVDPCCGLQSHVTVSLYIFLLVMWFCCCRKRPSITEMSVWNLRRHTHYPDWRVSLLISLHTRKSHNITLLFHVFPNSHSIATHPFSIT